MTNEAKLARGADQGSGVALELATREGARKAPEVITNSEVAERLYDLGFRLSASLDTILTDTYNEIRLVNVVVGEVGYWADGTNRHVEDFFELLDVPAGVDKDGQGIDEFLYWMTVAGKGDQDKDEGYKKKVKDRLLASGFLTSPAIIEAWGARHCFDCIVTCTQKPEEFVTDEMIDHILRDIIDSPFGSQGLKNWLFNGEHLKYVIKLPKLAEAQFVGMSVFWDSEDKKPRRHGEIGTSATEKRDFMVAYLEKYGVPSVVRIIENLGGEGAIRSGSAFSPDFKCLLNIHSPETYLALLERYNVIREKNVFGNLYDYEIYHKQAFGATLEIGKDGVPRVDGQVVKLPFAVFDTWSRGVGGVDWQIATPENIKRSKEDLARRIERLETELAEASEAMKNLSKMTVYTEEQVV